MFSTEITVGFLAFIFALLINRVLAERALRLLTAEQKAALLDSFSVFRTYGTFMVALLVVVFIIVTQALPARRLELVRLFFVAIVLSQIARTAWSYSRLNKLGVPKSYVSSFLLRCVIYFSGLTVFVLMLLKQYRRY